MLKLIVILGLLVGAATVPLSLLALLKMRSLQAAIKQRHPGFVPASVFKLAADAELAPELRAQAVSAKKWAVSALVAFAVMLVCGALLSGRA